MFRVCLAPAPVVHFQNAASARSCPEVALADPRSSVGWFFSSGRSQVLPTPDFSAPSDDDVIAGIRFIEDSLARCVRSCSMLATALCQLANCAFSFHSADAFGHPHPPATSLCMCTATVARAGAAWW